ncbi:YciI family protein [Prochlorococcus sp. MIT 1341]|uniref:YciI family protein n=1 Tax=Prochlorococcus sp. MIT 1341 TaxID=3096221 RepID=UPI002A748408|nr:YciI family protein [Prochlorococcus sp. MIT 1341]
MDKFVLWGTYCENALEKRTPFREEHLDRLGKLKHEGTLVTLGPTKCSSYVFGIFEASTIDRVREILEEDIYWKEGIWTSLEVYPWVQAF